MGYKKEKMLTRPILKKAAKIVSSNNIMNVLKSKNNVFVQGMAATPTFLTRIMTEWGISNKLDDINVYHLHTEGECPYIKKEARPHFRCRNFFTGQNVRSAIEKGYAEYVPVFMSDVPSLFRRKIIPLDVALVQMSPPDKDGLCSLGPSVEASFSAIENAKHVICQINKNIPRTLGDALVHIDNVDTIVEHDSPLYTSISKKPQAEDAVIGRLIATHLVPDGATLQIGIGSIPNMVLNELFAHKDIGIHSEMFSDGVVDLINNGVVTNSKKKLDAGKLVASFLMGSPAFFEFVNDNPIVEMRDAAYTNNPFVIKEHNHMIAINSAIEVDITGQVCSDSIGTRIYSGFGGQLDFMYGASIAEHGKAIIALHSRTSKGKPRIVPYLKKGAGVVTTRGHVDYIVTEHGIASLRGKSIQQRVRSLIDIAHPNDRLMLSDDAKKRNLI